MAAGCPSSSNPSPLDSRGVQEKRAAPRQVGDISQEQYDELKRIAWALHRRLPVRNLTRTALLHDALVKLYAWSKLPPPGDPRFNGLVVQAMRHVLVDAVRKSLSAVHGGGLRHVTLTERAGKVLMPPVEFLDVNHALDELAEVNARQADAFVLMKVFGYTLEETAAQLKVTSRTVQRDLRVASAWLASRLRKSQEL
jgi:RNA polymerase sigma factor (TIGR02999 family)